jgi:cell division septation protein DedD
MRYRTANSGSSDLGQRVLFALLGVACVVLCYFIGAYWLGPWLHRVREGRSVADRASQIASPPSVTPAQPTPYSPSTPKLVGVQIRERDPSTLPDTVRVVPPAGAAVPEETAPAEEPQPPETLEEHPSPPPANLWNPTPPAVPPASRADTNGTQGGIQVPQSLDGEAAPAAQTDVLYRVRLPNTFENRDDADAMMRTVVEKGLPAAVVTDTTAGRKVFRVQLGVYRNRSGAERLAEQARKAGLSAEVTTPSP